MRKILQVATLCLSATLLAGAEFYKWVDENGVVHYSEQPPESGQSIELQIVDPKPVAPSARDVAAADPGSATPATREAMPPDASRGWSPTTTTPEQARCYQAWIALQDLQRRGDVYLDEAGRLHHADSLHGFWYESWRRWLSDSERREWEDRYEAEVALSCHGQKRAIRRNAEAWNRWYNAGECGMARTKLEGLRGDDAKTPREVIRRIERLISENCG